MNEACTWLLSSALLHVIGVMKQNCDRTSADLIFYTEEREQLAGWRPQKTLSRCDLASRTMAITFIWRG